MPAVGLTRDDFNRVFGTPSAERETGRSRRCRFCGDWHRLDRPWPHNCRDEAPPRADFATPMIAPKFEPFRTGVLEGAEIINSRRDKREYMAKNDLVEWDDGVQPERGPTEREEKEVFAREVKRFAETDPLNIEPVDRIGETDTDGSGDIATDVIEVAT